MAGDTLRCCAWAAASTSDTITSAVMILEAWNSHFRRRSWSPPMCISRSSVSGVSEPMSRDSWRCSAIVSARPRPWHASARSVRAVMTRSSRRASFCCSLIALAISSGSTLAATSSERCSPIDARARPSHRRPAQLPPSGSKRAVSSSSSSSRASLSYASPKSRMWGHCAAGSSWVTSCCASFASVPMTPRKLASSVRLTPRKILMPADVAAVQLAGELAEHRVVGIGGDPRDHQLHRRDREGNAGAFKEEGIEAADQGVDGRVEQRVPDRVHRKALLRPQEVQEEFGQFAGKNLSVRGGGRNAHGFRKIPRSKSSSRDADGRREGRPASPAAARDAPVPADQFGAWTPLPP